MTQGRQKGSAQHLEERLELRRIPRDLPEQVIRRPERTFTDMATGYSIVVSHVPYRGASRLMMVVFEETDREMIAVTMHPLDEHDVQSKVRSGRWVE